MPRIQRLIAWIVCLILTQSACSPATPLALAVSATPTFVPQPATPQAMPAPTLDPASAGVPVFEFYGNKSQLAVISSLTGEPMESFAVVPIGDGYSYTFAPDGRALALVTNARLYMIDLLSWNIHEYDLGLHGWISSMVYRGDGSLLAVTSGEPESELWIVNPGTGEVLARRKADFSIRVARFTADGSGLMTYGPQIASTGVAANAGVSIGPPRAALYTVSDLELRWSVDLTGIRDGTFPKKENIANTQDIYLPGAAWHDEPGRAFAPNQDILYLVHGDQDQLTTVDFARQIFSTVDIRPKTSWLDRLVASTAGVAYAKGMDGTVRQAFISPDGKFLFVGGNTATAVKSADGIDWSFKDTALGLQMIDATDGTLVSHMDTEAALTGLSPDGQQVFLTTWSESDGARIPRTAIYDASSLRLVKELAHVYLMPTRRLDGTTILVSTEYIGNNGSDVCNLATVEMTTWTLTSQWEGYCVIWLTTP